MKLFIILFLGLTACDIAMCQQVSDSLLWNGMVLTLDEESDMKFTPASRNEWKATDTLHWEKTSIVIDINSFIQPPICMTGHDGSFSRQYIFNRNYSEENLSHGNTEAIRKPAAYIWVYAGKPLCGFCAEKNEEILYSGINRNKGRVLKYVRSGLYFRYDSYCDGHIVVTYNYVREEDRETFEKILDNVIIEKTFHSQISIDTSTFSNFNWITKQDQTVKKYRITNNSDEDYLTWIGTVPVDGHDSGFLITKYFFKPIGDFSFGALMYDYATTDPGCIGATFLKNISAGESFSYFIIKTNIKSDFYEDRIVIMRRSEVEQFLKIHIDEEYLYQLQDIFLTETDSLSTDIGKYQVLYDKSDD